jgi:hypothetical protein
MPSNRLWFVPLMLSAALLAACGSGGDNSFYITKQWQDWTIRLETRPHPIQAGHDEFLLHVMGSNRQLPLGMIVHYRMSPKDDWIQAMPDGLSDIFRRALPVDDPAHAKLYVHLQYKGKEGDLLFDLSGQ